MIAVGTIGQLRVGLTPNKLGGLITYPLDLISAPAATAYSGRKMSAAYTGFAMRVRRSSDNAEQNIGFNSLGNLDAVALLDFTGANSGFVVTWYDQSGFGRNATQATAANQYRIVNNGVYDGCLYASVATSGFIHTIPTQTPITPLTVISVNAPLRPLVAAQINGLFMYGNLTTANQRVVIGALSNSATVGSRPTSSAPSAWTGLAYNTAAPYVASFVKGTSPDMSGFTGRINNGTPVSGAAAALSTYSTPNMIIGAGTGATTSHDLIERVIFDSALTDSDREKLERNQGAYYGMSVA